MSARHALPPVSATILLILFLSVPAVSQAQLDLPLLVPSITALSSDLDGDGLPDAWERNGYRDGGVFVNLPAMGADPKHKDIFVWMDYMVRPGEVSLAPSQAAIDHVIEVFANAPVTNPDGKNGVAIHPQLKNQVPFAQTLGDASDENKVWTDFDALKNASFDSAYRKSFRYMIWANSYESSTSSGLARGIPGVDFIVSLGEWDTPGGTVWEKTGTFIHELGHCLGLTHGGVDHENYKPNYLSVMNYAFQTTGLYKDGHWGDSGYPLHFDYQRLNTPALDKSHLNESLGLTGADDVSAYGTVSMNGDVPAYYLHAAEAIDWNRNGTIETDVAADINNSNNLGVITAQNNWPHINYNANKLIGPFGAPGAAVKPPSINIIRELRNELDLETAQKLKFSRPF